MSDRRPSNVANDRAAPWRGRRAVTYCEELRDHLDEFVETRHRLAIALGVVTVIGIALLATGRATMAAFFGLAPGSILLVFAVGNEWMIRRTTRRIASDCLPEPRDL